MMREILLTSSALIVALLVLRQAFKGVLSRRVQYALWGLVLIRLLVPFSLPAAEFSVLTAAQPVQAAVEERWNTRPALPAAPAQGLQPANPVTPANPVSPTLPETGSNAPGVAAAGQTPAASGHYAARMGAMEALTMLWKLGMALMGAFFVVSNLAFYLRLRKHRREWQDLQDSRDSRDGSSVPAGQQEPSLCPATKDPLCPAAKVYLVPDGVIPSPCLFGRSIYLTPAVAEDESKLRHVLAHEATHARHLDPLWSLLRCACLTVYWFDPLVWAAAVCSKTDCELACDESVLQQLGEAERIPYGRTLVSLIPVRRGSNPLLAATTMTAGKKQLRDRITRIAQKPRQLLAAALAVAVLAGVVSACTFTGAKVTPAPSPSQDISDDTLRSLTGEELRWFNEEYFNHNPNPAISYTYSIRNQFANPINLYEKPEDIDLGELLYLEGSAPSNEELRTILGTDPNDLPCGAYKLTTAEINDILRQYTGLTLEQMSGELRYTYDEDTDAWYWMHGDTNYCGNLDFTVGTREGSTVKLYHYSDYAASGWYCVTLKAQEDGSYWFLSNQACEAPAISTPLPAGEPTAVIDLSALEPYTAPVVTTERHEGDFVFSYENNLQNWNIDGHHIRIYRSTDGAVYAAEELEDGAMNVFAQYSFDDVDMFFFHDLFGHDGFTVTYYGQVSEHRGGTIVDYYYFDGNGVPALLCRTGNDFYQPIAIDLNGDGTSELVTEEELFFQREGRLYRADLPQLLGQALSEPGYYWDSSAWDKYSKCLVVNGSLRDEKIGGRECTLLLFFDGNQVLVYKQGPKSATDHVVDGVDAGVPDQVVEDAKNYVLQEVIEEGSNGTWLYRDREENGEAAVVFDDWRIESFTGFYSEQFGDTVIEGWAFNYELHTTTPKNVVLAGGRYITEDDWVSPGYPGCEWLFYRLSGTMNENRELLWGQMINDASPDSWGFKESVIHHLEQLGVDLGGTSVAAEKAAQALALILDHSGGQVRVVLATPDGVGGGEYLLDPNEGNGPYYLDRMKDNYVVWSWAETPAADPTGPSVTFSSPDWYAMLQFWQDSGLVMYKQQNREPQWYEVRYDGDPTQDVYAYRAYPYYWARCWFDEAEYEAIEAELPLIPDGDQSYLNIVQEWAEAHEGLMTRLSPGSSMNCTYVKVTGAGTLEDMPETWFPADILDYPHFAFTYDVAFVPENQDALNTLMAGNTGEYEGGDPDVPQGAFTYSRRGSMYLKDGYWYCGSLGTG